MMRRLLRAWAAAGVLLAAILTTAALLGGVPTGVAVAAILVAAAVLTMVGLIALLGARRRPAVDPYRQPWGMIL